MRDMEGISKSNLNTYKNTEIIKVLFLIMNLKVDRQNPLTVTFANCEPEYSQYFLTVR